MGLTLLVLAAGMGSRFGGLKQKDHFGPSGETIIDYSVHDAIEAGFTKVVFVIRREFEDEFKADVSSKYEGKIQVEYAYQELNNIPDDIMLHPERVKPLGTGHAVWVARKKINESFAVINADDFYGRNAFAVMVEYLKDLNPDSLEKQCMVGYILRNTLSDNGDVSRGICELNDNSELLSITERTKIERKGNDAVYYEDDQIIDLSGDEIASMNMMGFTSAALEAFDNDLNDFLKNRSLELKSEFYLPTVLNNLVRRGQSKVKVLKTDANWFGVTYKEDKPIVVKAINDLVEKGVYPKKLWS
jgi:UTP-glucose-1-phosphate uridylyltransferase